MAMTMQTSTLLLFTVLLLAAGTTTRAVKLSDIKPDLPTLPENLVSEELKEVTVLVKNEAKCAVTVTVAEVKKKATEVVAEAEALTLVGVFEVVPGVVHDVVLTISVLDDGNIVVKKSVVLHLLDHIVGKREAVVTVVEETTTSLMGAKQHLLKLLVGPLVVGIMNLIF